MLKIYSEGDGGEAEVIGSKENWILLVLRKAPLDRIHLMKALFLIWHRSGRALPNYFKFEPYLYGPCSFEVYDTLSNISRRGLVVEAPHPAHRWTKYYLTAAGSTVAEQVAATAARHELELVDRVTREVAQLGFYAVLKKVYSEAPDFASASLLGGMFKR